jgi:hypothetical protein
MAVTLLEISKITQNTGVRIARPHWSAPQSQRAWSNAGSAMA